MQGATLSDLVDTILRASISESELWFRNYILDHKEEIQKQLTETGEYVIRSPYGLVATITTKEKGQREKQS